MVAAWLHKYGKVAENSPYGEWMEQLCEVGIFVSAISPETRKPCEIDRPACVCDMVPPIRTGLSKHVLVLDLSASRLSHAPLILTLT